MLIRLTLSLVSVLLLASCSLAGTTKEVEITPEQISSFHLLLRDGWDLHIYEGQLILIKDVGTRIETRDPFNVLK
jgi:hypothetical protein